MSDPNLSDASLVDFDAMILESILSSVPSPSTSLHSGTGSSVVSDTPPAADSPLTLSPPDPNRSSSFSPVQGSASKRVKKGRTQVELAPGQPPTARGNPRIRVFVACYQCRARKIRCDGAKPICYNCQKRPSEAEQCSYDKGPNRRGPDKGRGRSSAQKSAGKTTSKRKPNPQSQLAVVPTDTVASSSDDQPALAGVDAPDDSIIFELSESVAWEYDPLLNDAVSATNVWTLQQPTVVVTPPQGRHEEDKQDSIPSRPSFQFARDTWWDALLTFYLTEHRSADDMQIVAPSNGQRSIAMKLIVSDLRAVFQSSPCWLSFINLPRFFDTLFSSLRRDTMQPSVLLSALALGTLAQSSEAENGARGRAKAMRLLDMAHGALEGSLATGWVDMGLAQAALLIVFFEMQSHPLQSLERSNSSLLLLDSIFRLFSLPNIDDSIKPRGHFPSTGFQPVTYGAQVPLPGFAQHPVAGFSQPGNVSVLDGRPLVTSSEHYHSLSSHGCHCAATSLGHNWPSVHNLAPSWSVTMMWPEGLNEADFRREEGRRLVWSAVIALANMNAYTAAIPGTMAEHGRLFVREPENFAVLLPGEALQNAGVVVEPDDIWTINLRTMLLLHACMRTRENRMMSAADRAQFAIQVWLEIDDIEQRLERHTCDMDSAFGFQTKELTFFLRMLTSYEFQRFIPQVTTSGSTLFYRDKAEGWLRYMANTADWIWKSLSLGSQSPSLDHRKSLLIFWFISNARRAITLWKADPGLLYGLEVSKRFTEHAEFLVMFWPNVGLRQVLQSVRYQLVDACLKAGVAPPAAELPIQVPLSKNAVHPSARTSNVGN